MASHKKKLNVTFLRSIAIVIKFVGVQVHVIRIWFKINVHFCTKFEAKKGNSDISSLNTPIVNNSSSVLS